jgi:ATP adenylyltransferase
VRQVDRARQRAALEAVLACLDPAALEVPARIERLLVPRPFGYGPSDELLAGTTAPAFDSLAAAATAADLLVALLLDPHRCARLVAQQASDLQALGLDEVLHRLAQAVFEPAQTEARHREISRRIQSVVVERLIRLAESTTTSPAVQAIVDWHLDELQQGLSTPDATEVDAAHRAALTRRIRQHLERDVAGPRPPQRVDPAPPGSPIGHDLPPPLGRLRPLTLRASVPSCLRAFPIPSPMTHENLWAPWRGVYLRQLEQKAESAGWENVSADNFLAAYFRSPEQDHQHHVIHRTGDGIVLLNRYPYANGHLLVALGEPRPSLLDYTPDQRAAFWHLVEVAMELMHRTLRPQGVNVGINQGRAAGAGVPEHLHAHLVPRWAGDTNFITVVGRIRVVPDSLEAMAEQYRQASLGPDHARS